MKKEIVPISSLTQSLQKYPQPCRIRTNLGRFGKAMGDALLDS